MAEITLDGTPSALVVPRAGAKVVAKAEAGRAACRMQLRLLTPALVPSHTGALVLFDASVAKSKPERKVLPSSPVLVTRTAPYTEWRAAAVRRAKGSRETRRHIRQRISAVDATAIADTRAEYECRRVRVALVE